MHGIQKILLKRLHLQNKQKYSILTSGYDFEDNIVFHLKQLISKGLVKKEGDYYFITAEGVKEITDYDLPTLEDTGFKTFFVGFLCTDGDKYLIKEHPTEINNCYNLPSGKPRFGEKTEDALIRTFEANTGIKLTPYDFKYQSLHLKTVKTSDGETLFDDAFAIYKVDINEEQKNQMRLHKQIKWMSAEEIKELSNRWPELDICIINQDTAQYKNYEFISDYILD